MNGARWVAAPAIGLAVLVLGLSTVVWFGQSPDVGFAVGARSDQYVVVTVTPGSIAEREGLRAGAVLSTLDGTSVHGLPQGWEWTAATARFDAAGEFVDVDLAAIRVAFNEASLGVLAGLALFVVGLWWLRIALGPELQMVAFTLPAATAVPLAIAPIAALGTPLGLVATWAVPAATSSLFAATLVSVLPSRRRGRIFGVCLALAIAAAVLGVLRLWSATSRGAELAAWLALAIVPAAPIFLLTRSRRMRQTRLLESDGASPLWLMAAACLPALAVLARGSVLAIPTIAQIALAGWVVVLFVWNTFDHRLARARLQRDVVVTVTEAERARLAADLHDVALQELTLLVRRLDTTGDAAGAAAARSVADRLRELCGELHLPVLDELGAGPALEWLVQRVAATTGDDVRLELGDGGRPPAGVELAVFRVAQEALSNAVRHAMPPIAVRYVSSPTSASLSVEDAGPPTNLSGGINPRPGHFGLATMQQRAEQIGALLSVRPWAGGGTRVSLEWRAVP